MFLTTIAILKKPHIQLELDVRPKSKYISLTMMNLISCSITETSLKTLERFRQTKIQPNNKAALVGLLTTGV
jgi:hypothetical protein